MKKMHNNISYISCFVIFEPTQLTRTLEETMDDVPPFLKYEGHRSWQQKSLGSCGFVANLLNGWVDLLLSLS